MNEEKGEFILPLEVVAEEGEGRIAENGGIGFTLFDEKLQFFEFSCVHLRRWCGRGRNFIKGIFRFWNGKWEGSKTLEETKCSQVLDWVLLAASIIVLPLF